MFCFLLIRDDKIVEYRGDEENCKRGLGQEMVCVCLKNYFSLGYVHPVKNIFL